MNLFAEHLPQLLLGVRQYIFLPGGKLRPGAIDVKIQHGHRRLKWAGLATMTALGGMFQRKRNAMRIVQFENTIFQIQRIAPVRDGGGPAILFFRAHFNVV